MRIIRRSLSVLPLLVGSALSACQLIAGLDDLDETSPGGGAGTPGDGCAELACRVEELRSDPDASPLTHIAVDSTHVFFGGRGLWRAPLAPDSEREQLAATGSPIGGLAVDDEGAQVVWTRSGSGALRQSTTGGTEASRMMTVQGTFMGPAAIHAGYAYWIVGPELASPGATEGLQLYCEDVLDDMMSYQASLGPDPFWRVGGLASAMVKEERWTFWHRWEGVWMRKACPEPFEENLFATYSVVPPETVFGLAADDRHIYWTHRLAGGSIYRKALESETARPGEVFAGNEVFPRHILVAGGHVYWSTSSARCDLPEGEIRRRPVSGVGDVEVVRQHMTCPSNFAVDAGPAPEHIYWADQGTIFRLKLTP